MPLFRETLSHGIVIAAQSEADAERFRSLGAAPERTWVTGNIINRNAARIIEFVAQTSRARGAGRGLPTIYARSRFADAGGLMSFGSNQADLLHRAATYVDKILKGAKPADLPIEQPRKFDLVINLKTAKELGLTIPPEFLLQATKVIK